MTDLRLLTVHAHPDDEVIQSGLAMARYADEGVAVTLVTCTLGEEGEVLLPELAHLAADKDDQLGPHRIEELAEAMQILGVADHRFLGGPGRYRDSGMVFDEAGHAKATETVREDSFWRADLLEASTHLVEIIREVRPQVLITYDELGNYGHPDHIQAHRVSTYAAALARVALFRPGLGDAWDIAKIYWTTNSDTQMREWIRRARAAGNTELFGGFDPDAGTDFPIRAAKDDQITAIISQPDLLERKLDAMRAHRSQITPDGDFFAEGGTFWGREYYALAQGAKGPTPPGSQWEDDLFAGLR